VLQLNAATGAPRRWLRAEGAAMLAAATIAYGATGQSWWLFLALFFVPDLSFAAYLLGPAAGALGYNLLHSYAIPLALIACASLAWPDEQHAGASGGNLRLACGVSLVWLAHIGFDRMLGYGLKYPSAFRDTHLGRL
jgi:hypothetical protein